MEPWKYTKYPPPKIKKSVPVHMSVADDTLRDFKLWYFDELSYGVVIVRDYGDLFILDPVDLLKFGRTDMTSRTTALGCYTQHDRSTATGPNL
ncbi:hypothetical protein E3N88_09280 [Mikania micrantha]|uniref:Uncharacterized protein n=1 Tax=Mikania micrantha TaxID=192012 RepID=A0A5N6PIP0_9ASTR|nr:hypothetical protein E3N88_09280 [Mikania micrantha]